MEAILIQYIFQLRLSSIHLTGLGCYLLLGKIVVDHDFPSLEIQKMEKLPMIPDPRYSDEQRPDTKIWDNMRVAHSYTSRAPYPNQEELDELYGRKPVSGKYEMKKGNDNRMALGGRK